MKRTSIVAAASAAAFLLLSLSCQQFFTTTLAGPLARSSYTVSATMPVDQATALLEGASPELAAALVTPLLAAAKAADPASPAYQAAASALLDAAVVGSGVTSAIGPILKNPEILVSGGDLSTVLSGFNSITLNNDTKTALALIAQKTPDDITADEAVFAAVALVADACNSTGAPLSSFIDGSTGISDDLKNNDSIEAAMLLISKVSFPANSPFTTLKTKLDGFN